MFGHESEVAFDLLIQNLLESSRHFFYRGLNFVNWERQPTGPDHSIKVLIKIILKSILSGKLLCKKKKVEARFSVSEGALAGAEEVVPAWWIEMTMIE